MLTFGIDPGPTFNECHCKVLRELNGETGVRNFSIDSLYDSDFSGVIGAVVLEWIDEKRGIFSEVRSRAEHILKTHSVGTSLRDHLLRHGYIVYCVPRDVILRQAGWRTNCKADSFVIDYLEVAELLSTKITATGTRRVTTAGLTNVNDRDALMCARFNWRHPDNQKFRASWGNNRCG